ncbi:MAG: hypothetical protein HKL81_10160 [Acidimicrobiaceae bacterium]|nr:hypothetical protein [Acidimicrobiaceae bacterium]
MAGGNRIRAKGVLVLLPVLILLVVGPFVVLDHIELGKTQSIGSSTRVTKKYKSSSTLRTTTTTPQTTTSTTLVQEPGGGVQLFLNRQVVAYYGLPGNPTLGVLGTTGASAAWTALNVVAQSYVTAGVKILPAFELITYVAQAGPGPDGTYSKRIPDSVIQHYLSVVQQNNGLLILDIQPGRGSFLKDAKSLAPYLSQPDVALALDPEWEVSSTQVPGKVIGHTTGEEINTVSKWLQGLTLQNHLPQKLLLVHQFKQSMVVDKWATEPRSGLAIVFNMDGFGSWRMKVKAYQLLESYTDFGLGFKLFYHQDQPLGSPQQVMALAPQPNVIEYQ